METCCNDLRTYMALGMVVDCQGKLGAVVRDQKKDNTAVMPFFHCPWCAKQLLAPEDRTLSLTYPRY